VSANRHSFPLQITATFTDTVSKATPARSTIASSQETN